MWGSMNFMAKKGALNLVPECDLVNRIHYVRAFEQKNYNKATCPPRVVEADPVFLTRNIG